MVGKYGEANSDHILHAEHMVGMPEKQREEYLASLSSMDAMGNQAMDANDIEKINLFAAEIDAANAAQQASNLAQAKLALSETGLDEAGLLGLDRRGSDYDRGPDEQRIWELKERERLRAGASGTGDKSGYASPTTAGPRS